MKGDRGPRFKALERDIFYHFCLQLRIESKEDGGIVPLDPLPTQVYLVNQIFEGLEAGIHHYTILKCRQSGCTTICLAFDLAWSFVFGGTIGAIIADSNDNKFYFRHLIREYIRGLPEGEEYRQPVTTDNREACAFSNRSLLTFLNANQRAKGTMGRGKGISLVHGSECGFWGDEEGLEALLASLAQTNPHRLYIFESTANGYNLFHKMYETSKRAVSQKSIFIGWWLHPDYTIPRGDPRFDVYWDGALTDLETGWVAQVERHWNYRITPGQIAWWRWFLYENYRGNLDKMYQEFPPTPQLAFQFSGTPYVDRTSLHRAVNTVMDVEGRAQYFKFQYGTNFANTEIIATDRHQFDLVIYEEPLPGVYYVIGCDPAFGVNDKSDRACAQVFACYSDRIEQVAEYAASNLPPYKFAWGILYLAIGYQNPWVIIELQGGGVNVLEEIERIRTDTQTGAIDKIGPLFGSMMHFLYRRKDSLHDSYTLKQWKTTGELRTRMLDDLKMYVERGLLVIRSEDLLSELHTLKRSKDGKLEAEAGSYDDRVMAAGLAIQAYLDPVLPYWLVNSERTYDKSHPAGGLRAQTNGEYHRARVMDWLQNALTKSGRAA